MGSSIMTFFPGYVLLIMTYKQPQGSLMGYVFIKIVLWFADVTTEDYIYSFISQ